MKMLLILKSLKECKDVLGKKPETKVIKNTKNKFGYVFVTIKEKKKKI